MADPTCVSVLPSLITAGAGLLGVVVGVVSTQSVAWWQKRKRQIGHWRALSAEIEICRDRAQAYITDHVLAPLYRLPALAYEEGFPPMLADGVLLEDEVRAVLSFYNIVEQINRGLDQAHQAAINEQEERLGREAGRIGLKAHELVDRDKLYDRIRAVVNSHLPKRK